MKKPDLRKISRRWQKRLRLTHWTLAVRYHRLSELDNRAGNVQFTQRTLTAHISVLDPTDWPNSPFQQDVEQIIVHELLHLWFCQVQPDDESRKAVCFEQAIDTVAKALVAQSRDKKGKRKSVRD